ncbi:MAG: ABC transporter ATP-binding protein [Brevinematia bacterium]
MAWLIVQNISLSYDKSSNIISNLSFTATTGDSILLEGRNGIGKTTILKSIAGIIKPVTGKILIDGHDVSSVSYTKRKKLVSLAQQSPNYSPPIKVSEFLEIALLENFSSLSSQRRIKRFVNLLEIEELLLRPINTLSEGQKKLALLCRTFIQGSEVILLDEPDAFLDIYNQKLVINAINEIVSEGKIVIFVSHNEHFYSQICNKKIQILSNSEFLTLEMDKIMS